MSDETHRVCSIMHKPCVDTVMLMHVRLSYIQLVEQSPSATARHEVPSASLTVGWFRG